MSGNLNQLRRDDPLRRDEDKRSRDCALLARYQQSRRDSDFGPIVERFQGLVIWTCMGVFGGGYEGHVEDVCQETFLVLAPRLRNGEKIDHPTSYIPEVARRVALAIRKRDRKQSQ